MSNQSVSHTAATLKDATEKLEASRVSDLECQNIAAEDSSNKSSYEHLENRSWMMRKNEEAFHEAAKSSADEGSRQLGLDHADPTAQLGDELAQV